MVSKKEARADASDPPGSVFRKRKREWAKENLAVSSCSSHHSLQGCGPQGSRSPTQNSLTSSTDKKAGSGGETSPTRELENRTACSKLERIKRSPEPSGPAGLLRERRGI